MFDNAPPSAGEIRALANQLLSWANHLSVQPVLDGEPTEDERYELALGRAVAARDAAHRRERAFPEIDFGNTAWLIVLELYIQQANGFRVSPERLPLVAFLPSDTVERALDRLRRVTLVEIVPDPANSAGRWVRLTEEGSCRMTALLLESTRPAGLVAAESSAL